MVIRSNHNLTSLEATTMNFLISCSADYPRELILKMAIGIEKMDDMFEGNVNDADLKEVAEECGITVNQAKGVIGSLEKKGYVWTTDEDDMMCPTMEGVMALVEDVRSFENALK